MRSSDLSLAGPFFSLIFVVVVVVVEHQMLCEFALTVSVCVFRECV